MIGDQRRTKINQLLIQMGLSNIAGANILRAVLGRPAVYPVHRVFQTMEYNRSGRGAYKNAGIVGLLGTGRKSRLEEMD